MADINRTAREGAVRAIVPAQGRFESHAAEVRERSYHLWSTVAGRNAALTASLLQREAENGAPVPAGSTVRRWAAEEAWDARADADLVQTSGRTLAQLRAGWLGALSLAQQTLLAAMIGELDDLPHAGAGRLKAAELVLKTLQHADVVIVPSESAARPPADASSLTTQQRSRLQRQKTMEENARVH